MSQCLCMVLVVLSTGCALPAQSEEPGIRNIVLVHGAWVDGSGWKGVYDILVKDGYTVNIHPMVFAAWFGMLATAINLLPFGQLDGGHITYATLGRWSAPISIATVGITIAMTFVTVSWLVMTLVMLVMLFMLGPRHPRVIYEHEPVGTARNLIAVFALIMFILCFTPVPIQFQDLVGGR